MTENEVSALRQLVLRSAIEFGAAAYAAAPGIGRSNAARYIWEALANTDDIRRPEEAEWIETYIRQHPEVFELPRPPVGMTLRERRRQLSAAANDRFMVAYQSGDLGATLHALDEAEALHPSPKDRFARARARVVALPAAAAGGAAHHAESGTHSTQLTASHPKSRQQQHRGGMER